MPATILADPLRLKVYETELEPPGPGTPAQAPAEPLRGDWAAVRVEDLEGSDRGRGETVTGDEADCAIGAETWCESGVPDAPPPRADALPSRDRQELLHLAGLDDDSVVSEGRGARDAVVEAPPPGGDRGRRERHPAS